MDWKFDPNHSAINFKARHMMITNVHGQFADYTIDMKHFDPDDLGATALEVRIDAASLETGVADRDKHLRSPDFLDVDGYPTITFKSTGVELVGDQQAKLRGDLTIRDRTNPVVLDVALTGKGQDPWGNQRFGFEAEGTIRRADWGLTWNVALETGGVLVSDEITIEIELQLIGVEQEREEPAAAGG
jgi:polyisoprenoid-binding protein YceI